MSGYSEEIIQLRSQWFKGPQGLLRPLKAFKRPFKGLLKAF